MDKTEQERCLRFCTDLSRMLEEEKKAAEQADLGHSGRGR